VKKIVFLCVVLLVLGVLVVATAAAGGAVPDRAQVELNPGWKACCWEASRCVDGECVFYEKCTRVRADRPCPDIMGQFECTCDEDCCQRPALPLPPAEEPPVSPEIWGGIWEYFQKLKWLWFEKGHSPFPPVDPPSPPPMD